MIMQQYIGVKVLGAKSMTRGEYNSYRGWTIPENENPSDEGYLVEYRDGGKPNDDRHDGYISWSPKDVFEASYRVVGVNNSMAEKLYDVYGTATNWIRASGEPMSRTLGEIQLNAQAAWQAVADAARKLGA